MAIDQYSTPGSAVADVLSQILVRRKADAQQAMMAKLAEDQRRKDEEYRQRQLTFQEAEQRRADAAETRYNADAQRAQEMHGLQRSTAQENLNRLMLEPYSRGFTDVEDVKNPTIRDLMIQQGVEEIQPMGPPLPEDGDALPVKRVYKGRDPQWQQQQEVRDRMFDLRSQVDETKQPEYAQWIDAVLAGAPEPSEGLLSTQPTYVFDQESGGFTPAAGGLRIPGTPVVTRTRPPRGQNRIIVPNATGPNGEPLIYDYDTNKTEPMVMPEGSMYKPGSPDITIFDNRLMELYSGVDKDTKLKDDTQRERAYRTYEDSLITQAQVSKPEVKNVMAQAIRDIREIRSKNRPLPPMQAFIANAAAAIPDGPNKARLVAELEQGLNRLLIRYYAGAK